MATNKFIELQSDEKRENQYIVSLKLVKEEFSADDKKLIEIVQSFIEIANADEFIHENEILLINEAIKTWDIKRELTKDRNDNKLQLINLS